MEEYFWVNGDNEITNYTDGIISNIRYVSSDGDETLTLFEKGIKTKELMTFSETSKKGLKIEKQFNSDGSTTEFSNIQNYRNPGDIIGDNDFVDIPLEERNNQFRLKVGFKTKDGELVEVPIQFDSGASSGLFLGYRLYQDLKSKCEVLDLNVS